MAAKAVVGNVDFSAVQLLSMVVNMFSFGTFLANKSFFYPSSPTRSQKNRLVCDGTVFKPFFGEVTQPHIHNTVQA